MKPSIIVRRAALATALFASAVVLSAPAQPGHALVSYGDLDLARPEAVQVLYSRISVAARRVCKDPTLRDLSAKVAYQRCYRTAVEMAVAKVNDGQLTALYRAKFPRAAAG